MSRAEEFDHGSDHKFSVKKNSAGDYTSCCGLNVTGPYNAKGWSGKIWYSESPRGYYYPSLTAAKEHMKRHHEGEQI